MARTRVVFTLTGEIVAETMPDFFEGLASLWEALPQRFAPDLPIRWQLVRLEEMDVDPD